MCLKFYGFTRVRWGEAGKCLQCSNRLSDRPGQAARSQAQPGTWFSAEPGMVTDSGFQTDGQWRLTAAQPSSVGEFSDTGDLWTLNYQVIASGLTQIVCEAYVFDASGAPLPLLTAEMALTVEGYPEAVVGLPTVESDPNAILELPTVEATDIDCKLADAYRSSGSHRRTRGAVIPMTEHAHFGDAGERRNSADGGSDRRGWRDD